MKSITNVDFNKFMKKHGDNKVKTNSGFNELSYGNVGKEISKAHSTIISYGTAIEKIIFESIKNTLDCVFEIKTFLDYNKLLDELDACRIDDDTFDISDRIYLIDRDIFEHIKHNDKRIKPDLLFIKVEKGKITFYIIEEKTGDNFDTKKSSGEKEHIIIFKEKVNAIKGIEKEHKILPIFSNKPKDKLSKSGFKGRFCENEIMSRDEFSELIGVNFYDIIKMFDNIREINISRYVNNLCEYSDIREKISNNSNVKNDIINDICNNPQSVDPQTKIKILNALNSL